MFGNQSQGLFPSQNPLGGGTSGSLFSQFNQPSTFSNPGGTSGSLFGGTAQSFQSSGTGGLFGGAGSSFGNTGTTQQSQGLFGGPTSTGAFGSSNFGANAPLNQNQPGGGFSTFSQATGQVTSQASGFGSLGQVTPGFGGNVLQQQTQGFGGGFGQQLGQKQEAQLGIFYQTQQDQNVHTMNNFFSEKREQNLDQTSKGPNNLIIYNIRAEPRYSNVTTQMLKLLDMKGMQQNMPQPNYEALAQSEWQTNQNQYVFLGKLGQVGGTFQQKGFGTTPQGFGQATLGGKVPLANKSLGLQTQQAIPLGGGGTSQGLFGAQQPTSSLFGQSQGLGGGGGSGLFGQQSTGLQKPLFQQQPGGLGQPQQQPSGSLFGQQQQTPFGQQSSGLFGQQQQPQQQQQQLGGGLFGQQQQQQPSQSLFGQMGQQKPQGLFGQQPSAGGGLFGQQQQPQQQPGFGLGQQPTQSTGLFGQGLTQQTPQQTSLFGQQQQQPSLFGQQQQQQPLTTQQPGGLFQQQPTQSTGLFGQQQPIVQPSQPGSLFGNKPIVQGSTQPSLFGAQATTTSTGPSLFSQQSTQSQPLFGQQQQPGLFGSGQQQPSLFSQQQQNQPLFGQQQTVQPSGLFSGPGQSQQMFGQQQPMMQQQQTPQQQLPLNLYDLTQDKRDIYGTKGSFLDKPLLLANAEQELAQLKAESDKLSQDPRLNPYYQFRKPAHKIAETSNQVGNFEIVQQIYEIDKELAEEYGQREMFEKQMKMKYGKDAVYEREQDRMVFNPVKGLKKNEKVYPYLKPYTYQPLPEVYPPSSQGLLTRPTPSQPTELPSPQPAPSTSPQKHPDIIHITAVLTDDNKQTEFGFDIHKSRDSDDVYKKVEDELEQRGIRVGKEGFIITYKNASLKRHTPLEKIGFSSSPTIYIILPNISPTQQQEDSAPQPLPPPSSQPHSQASNLSTGNRESKHKVQFDLKKYEENIARHRPKPVKNGYSTVPEWQVLMNMNDQELQNVKDFTIYNEHGRIQFIGQTDITDLDLADLVTISHSNAEVYDDKRHNKHPVGQKLNKPAIITLYNIKCKNNVSEEKKEQILRDIIQKSDAEHLSYSSKTGQWKFKVKHFTKYGCGAEDNEEEVEPVQYDSFHSEHVDFVRRGCVVPQPNLEESDLDSKDYFQEEGDFSSKPKFPLHFSLVDSSKRSREEAQAIHQQAQSSVHESSRTSQKPSIQEDQDEMKMFLQNSLEDYEQMSEQSAKRLHREGGGEEEMMQGVVGLREEREVENVDDRVMRHKLLTNIHDNFRLFKKIDETVVKKPTPQETLQYLRRQGVNNFKKSSLGQLGGVVRPTFRPNGQIVIVNQRRKQILMTQVKPMSQLQVEGVHQYCNHSHIFINHANIKPLDTTTETQLNRQMHQMNLHKQKPSAEVPMDIDVSSSMTQSIEDGFMADLLKSAKLPFVQMQGDPKDMSMFLKELSEKYRIMIRDRQKDNKPYQKVMGEFHVIGMLNALFGNPYYSLILLNRQKQDWNYLERPAYGQQMDSKGDLSGFEEGDTYSNCKKRRQAVSEILRSYCQRILYYKSSAQSNSSNQEKIYDSVLFHLLNGNFSEALKILKIHRKFKMAMFISTTANNPVAQEQLKQQIESHPTLYRNLSRSAKQVLNLLVGEYKIDPSKVHWTQALIYYTLFKVSPSASLRDLITQFHHNIYQPLYQNRLRKQPIMYQLLKLYAGIDRFETMRQFWKGEKMQMYETNVIADYRLLWIVQLVIRSVTTHYRKPQFSPIYLDSSRSMDIPDSAFFKVSLQFLNQCLCECDSLMSVLVVLLIPVSYDMMKKRLLLEVILRKIPSYLSTDIALFNIQLLLRCLKVPPKFLFSSRAILYQSVQQYTKAMTEWKLAENWEQVHTLVLNHVLPLYFHAGYCYPVQFELIEKNKELLKEILNPLNLQKNNNVLRNFLQRGGIASDFLNNISVQGGSNIKINLARGFDYMVKNSMIENEIVDGFIKYFVEKQAHMNIVENFSRDAILSQDNADISSFA